MLKDHNGNKYKDHYGDKYLLLSCAILGIIIYVTSLSVIHVFILLNKVKSNQIKSNVQRHIPHMKLKAFIKNNTHVNLDKLVIVLCSIYSLLCCTVWPYTFGSFSYDYCGAFSLEAYNASKGGVLSLYIMLVTLLLIMCAYAQ